MNSRSFLNEKSIELSMTRVIRSDPWDGNPVVIIHLPGTSVTRHLNEHQANIVVGSPRGRGIPQEDERLGDSSPKCQMQLQYEEVWTIPHRGGTSPELRMNATPDTNIDPITNMSTRGAVIHEERKTEPSASPLFEKHCRTRTSHLNSLSVLKAEILPNRFKRDQCSPQIGLQQYFGRC